MKNAEIFAVAGEESANHYLKKIIKTFKEDKKLSHVKFSGIGLKTVKKEGFEVVFNAEKLAVMGAFELLSKWKAIKEAFDLSLNYIEKQKPAVVLLIDFGGLNLRLAKKIKEKKLETKVVYFISPKIWAWNEKRALKVKNFVDEMLVIHPFEVPFYKKWGVEAKFVGHPLLYDVKEEYKDPSWKKEQKIKYGLDPSKPVLGLLMGSRSSEIKRHLKPYSETLAAVKKVRPDVQPVFVIPPSHSRSNYKEKLVDLKCEYLVLQSQEPMESMALFDVALACSGTATLELGLLGIPMGIAYVMNPLSMFLAKKFVKGVKYAGLVNILSDREICKEFLQEDFIPQKAANYLLSFLNSEEKYFAVRSDLLALKSRLGSVKTYSRVKDELSFFL